MPEAGNDISEISGFLGITTRPDNTFTSLLDYICPDFRTEINNAVRMISRMHAGPGPDPPGIIVPSGPSFPMNALSR